MAGISVDGGSSGNSLDTELNLVPFIDLLSTLVLFLLLSVVWVQVSVIPASVDSKGGKAKVSATDNTNLELHVTSSSVRITWPSFIRSKVGGLPGSVGKTRSGYDTRKLVSAIEKAVKANLSVAAVSAEDNVDYGDVIEIVDAAKSAGVPTVALSTTR